MNDTALDAKAIKLEVEFLKHELEEVKAIHKSVLDLTIQMKEITTEIRYMRELQQKNIGRIDDLEAQPKKKWDGLVTTVITGLVTLILGFIFAYIGLK